MSILPATTGDTASASSALSGDPAALLARTRDLSRRLQEREEFYRAVLESLSEGVLITDRENRILWRGESANTAPGHGFPRCPPRRRRNDSSAQGNALGKWPATDPSP
jgi:hypothetical protein